MASPSPPHDRGGFEIAIICALPLEADAVITLFDAYWEDKEEIYGKAEGDPNAYTTGAIGGHNVVVAHMPGIGKVNAAAVAFGLRSSFRCIKLALVVGTCGGVPDGPQQENIYLGDVIISRLLIQYDFGRQYPKAFERKDTAEDRLGRTAVEIRSFLKKLETDHHRGRLQDHTHRYLMECQQRSKSSMYPGVEFDRLFESSYLHQHGPQMCDTCSKEDGTRICANAIEKTCGDLGCERRGRFRRERQKETQEKKAIPPSIHIGFIGSSDTVMKSGMHRDEIAKNDKIIAFEMEGAGVWDYLPSLVIKGVCNYADSHKDKQWQGYAAAAAAACAKAFLKGWPSRSGPSQEAIATRTGVELADSLDSLQKQRQRQGALSTEERDCLQTFWPPGIDYISQKDQNPKRVSGTCLWTLKNPKYIEWRENYTKKLLWISADPGCGKSVLARCIIDEDLQQPFKDNPSRRVFYYFFKDTSPEQRSVTRATSTILYQLFASQPQLIRYALPSYREIGAALSTTFSKLWSIFTAAVTDPLAGDIICIFDALDECNEQEQPMLIKALEDFCLRPRTSSSASRLRFLVTSRPYFEIRRGFDKLLEASTNIELAGNDESATIKKEIDAVIKHRVAELAKENRLGKKVSDHLEKRLLETEHRTYLWLWLLWEIIKKDLSGTITEMNELIDNLPSGIHDTYETLLQRCPKPLFARKVLQIVLVAGRPLTLKEIDVALKVNEQTLSYADLELEGPARLKETLSTRCGLMISVIDSKVYFIHQTVKGFLLYKDGTEYPARKTWQQSLDLEESHNLMAGICLQSITFSEIRSDQADLCNALLPEKDREMEPNEYCRRHTLLPYSAIYWADHFRYRKNRKNSKDWKSIERFLETSDFGSIKRCWGTVYGNTLHAASAGGHGKIVWILLEKGADINAQGGWCGTALQVASIGGYSQVVQILLEKGADINAQSGYYGTALQAASIGGYSQVVQILLEKGAGVNVQRGWCGTALQAASIGGYSQVVQILLEKGADINAQGGWHGTALAAASKEGHEKIVQILLGNGAQRAELEDCNEDNGLKDKGAAKTGRRLII